MEIINDLIGHGHDLNALQMSVRGIIVFFVALLLIRFTGMRVFGIRNAFDTCIIIMLGSILSRAITGSYPFIPTLTAAIVLMVIHKIIATLSIGNSRLSDIVKGTHISLYKNGILNEKNLRKCGMSYSDILEEVRMILHQHSLSDIHEIFMERTGKISVIEKKKSIEVATISEENEKS
ncbi:MAG: DUF421 domain-containing protein [Ginsengibacter sp.]